MGVGSPVGAWLNWIYAACNEVRQAKIRAVGNGGVQVTVWGSNGSPVSVPGLAAISAYLASRIPTCSFLAPGSPANATPLQINPSAPLPTSYSTMAISLYGYGTQQTNASLIAAIVTMLETLVAAVPLGGTPIIPGSPDLAGVSNAFLVEAIMNLGAGNITRVVISITNYSNGVVLGASGPGADLVMYPVSGGSVALEGPPAATAAGWGIAPWNIL